MTENPNYKHSKKYDEKNRVQFNIRLNRPTDGDIIEFLATCENKQGLFKKLIRDEIERRKAEAE